LPPSASAVAFDDAGNLFVSVGEGSGTMNNGVIYEFTPSGVQSTFATTGLIFPHSLAFQIPEPSALAMFGIGSLALLGQRRRARVSRN
jgi:hypothetical protein